MRAYSLSHVSDRELLHGLTSLVAQDRATTARLLAHIAEFDSRRLYLPAAFPSMFAYCVHELRLSEDAAYKRIQAARVARQFPIIFEALADGRLHLTAVGLLAPHLTPANAEELFAAAAYRTKAEIEELLATRFPRSEMLGLVETLPASPSTHPHEQLAPDQVAGQAVVPGPVLPPGELSRELAPAQVAFGSEFMRQRDAARRRATTRRQEREARAAEEALRTAAEARARAAAEEVITPLRVLGFSAAAARRAIHHAAPRLAAVNTPG